MTNLINLTKFIQEIKQVDTRKAIKFPRIAILGSPACGKSTLIEALIGFSFIPKDIELKAYKYLEVTIENHEYLEIIGHDNCKLDSIDHLKHHLSIFYGDRIETNNKEPLKITIRSPKLPNITFYDLPGLESEKEIDRESSNQIDFENIEKEIFKKKIAKNVLKDDTVLIFCLMTVEEKINKSIAFKVAREYDPKGERTLGLITKSDLINPQNLPNFHGLINGNEFPLKHGYISLSPRKISLEDGEYFNSHDVSNPRSRIQNNHKLKNRERELLYHKLIKLIYYNMRSLFTSIYRGLGTALQKNEEELYQLGNVLQINSSKYDNNHIFLQKVWELANNLCTRISEEISGQYVQVNKNTTNIAPLCIGATMKQLFSETYNELSKIKTDDDNIFTEDEIIKIIRNFDSVTLDGFISLDAFKYVIMDKLSELKNISLGVLNKAHKIIVEDINSLIDDVFNNFAQLPIFLQNIINEFLQNLIQETKFIVERMLEANTEYVYTIDPEFMKISDKLISEKQLGLDNDLNQNPETARSSKTQGSNNPKKLGNSASLFPDLEEDQNETELDNNINSQRLKDEKFLASEIKESAICYYKSVIRNVSDTVPRIIGRFFLLPIQKQLHSLVLDSINKQYEINPDLFDINQEIIEKRNELMKISEKIQSLRRFMLRDNNIAAFLRDDGFIDNVFTRITKLKQDYLLDRLQKQYQESLKYTKTERSQLQKQSKPGLMQRFKNWITGKNRMQRSATATTTTRSLLGSEERNNIRGSTFKINFLNERSLNYDKRSNRTRAKSPNGIKLISEENDERNKTMIISDFVIIDDFYSKGTSISRLLLTKTDWLKIIDKGDFEGYSNDRIHLSIQNGIPSELRPSIWLILAKIKELKKQHPKYLFEKLSKMSSKWDDLIEKDVNRTLQDDPFFTKEEYDGKEKLTKILKAYASFDPGVGYTQGMHAVAANLLMTFSQYKVGFENQDTLAYSRNAERNSFWMLVYIMKEKGWRYFYVDQTPKLIESLDILDTRLKKDLPDIHKLMEESGFAPYTLFSHYFLTLMSYDCPFEFTKRFLDAFLISDERIIFDVLIKIMEASKKHIANMKDDISAIFKFIKYDMISVCFNEYKKELDVLVTIP